MGEFPICAFLWPVKVGLFTQNDFEGNIAWGAACTEQSLRSRTCSSSVVLASAGVGGRYYQLSANARENRNMTVNSSCAWSSGVASSLCRTFRTAIRWRVDTLVNREVWVHLGLFGCPWVPMKSVYFTVPKFFSLPRPLSQTKLYAFLFFLFLKSPLATGFCSLAGPHLSSAYCTEFPATCTCCWGCEVAS